MENSRGKGHVWALGIINIELGRSYAPKEYVPERFDVSNKKDFSDYYFPFGGGPRMCVGNNFAMQEMILTVAELLRKYRLESDADEIPIDPLISLKPVAVNIYFKLR